MKNYQSLIAIICCLSIYGLGYAQTAGSGTLATIESLVKQELSNSEKIGDFNRKYQDTYVLEDAKLNRLNQELAKFEQNKINNQAAVKQRLADKLFEIENSTSWKNRRESARKGYKEYNPGTCSAGGPPPICVANHWYKVSVSQALAEYEAYKEKELDKIRKQLNKFDSDINKKRQEIYEFQFGENEFYKQRENLNRQINELRSKNDDLRDRIAELSKKYTNQIANESTNLQNADIRNVMMAIAVYNYTELRIAILEAKIADLNEEERIAMADIERKMTEKNNQAIEDLEFKMNQKKERLRVLKTRHESQLYPLEKKLKELKNLKYQILQALRKKEDYSDKQIDSLRLEQKIVEDKIESREKEIEKMKFDFNQNKTQLETEIKQHDDEIWNLKINLPGLILKAKDNLREAFDTKRQILQDGMEGRRAKLRLTETLIDDRRALFRENVKQYESKVEPERIRLMTACSEGGVSCWGSGVVGDIWQHANKLLSCAAGRTYDPISYSGRYTGCEAAYEAYTTHFSSLTNGVSDREIASLQKNGYSYKYSDLLDKIGL